MKKPTTKPYALRIDGPLVKPLQELKKQNRRSLNAEINAALEAWLAVSQAKGAPSEDASSKSSDGSQDLPTTKHPRAKKQPKRVSEQAPA